MKKFVVLCLFIILFASACSPTSNQDGKLLIDDDFRRDFQCFVDGTAEIKDTNWYFRFGSIDYCYDMSYQSTNKRFYGIEAYCEIANGIVHPGENDSVLICYKVPYSATYSVNCSVRKMYHDEIEGNDGILFSIMLNKTTELFFAEIARGDENYHDFSDDLQLKKGDILYFIVDPYALNYFDSTDLQIKILAEN